MKLRIGMTLQWGKPPYQFYRIAEGENLFSFQSRTNCSGYSLQKLEEYIKEGYCKIYFPPIIY